MRWIEESSFDVKEHLTAAVEHDGVKWLEIRCNYKFISSIVSDDKILKDERSAKIHNIPLKREQLSPICMDRLLLTTSKESTKENPAL